MEHLEIKRVQSSSAVQEAAHLFYQQLQSEAFFSTSNRCLFLSGGSCIDVALAFVKALPTELSLSGTTVLLADERWVAPGSADSNEQQLRDKGVIQLLEQRGARFVPILGVNEDPVTTVQLLNQQYQEVLSSAERAVLLAGIGPDGHTVGMIPDSDSTSFREKFSSKSLVQHYALNAEQNNPFRERVTITLTAISKMSSVVIYAVGENKREALKHLQHKDVPLHQAPALGLYVTPGTVVLISDLEL